MSILEKGTAKGRCAAALILETPDGKRWVCEMTASMLMTIGAGARGAKERFGDDDL